ncbi:hypothetical protein Y717_09285 [Streptomyces scopuliridis RB72]|uniref:DNA-directed RNA polymerase specialized sigma24 family protein n=2 Tax=Streptomyces scopuliridis TaxID=452529 RepID=A0A2T7SPQ6_9ACTN|nr:hypothetical protein Y717_09285 [Streptomyces scopuliridis RB72]
MRKGTVPMPSHRQPTDNATTGPRPGVDDAEAALVEHYPRLVRLAYLTLPPTLGRHRRVLTAHATVQHVLPGARKGDQKARVPGQRTPSGSAFAWLRGQVLRAALTHEQPTPWWRVRAVRPRTGLPLVVGLRLFPRADGTDELALDQALSTVNAPARAALALRVLEGLSEQAVRALLEDAGVADPAAAVRTAERLAAHRDGRAGKLLATAEFDPCTVQTRPTDLLRRRQRSRIAGATVAIALAATVLAVSLPGDGSPERSVAGVRAEGSLYGPAGTAALARALDPALLERAPEDAWADTSRIDFSVWPARGGRTDDTALLKRALRVWGGPGPAVRVSATPGTGTAPPTQPPRLLYAGDLDGAAVVLLHDGQRIVRYAEPESGPLPDSVKREGPAPETVKREGPAPETVKREGPAPGGGTPSLDFARADQADLTTAAALAVSRTPDGARYLLAPWIAGSATRDLLAPDAPARGLDVSAEGVTDAVPAPASGGDCVAWPVMALRSSERIVERHSFLVTDLGDPAPAHLTYTPPPGDGAPARGPREATAEPALLSWARTACALRTLRGSGVRAVNNWVFAEQPLPESGGRAAWVCTRADTWRGPGRILVQFQRPASVPTAPGTVVAEAGNTASCGRFGQHILAGTRWKSPSGKWFLLAAGSRDVTRIEAVGSVRANASATTLAVRAPREGSVRLSARLTGGGGLRAVG